MTKIFLTLGVILVLFCSAAFALDLGSLKVKSNTASSTSSDGTGLTKVNPYQSNAATVPASAVGTAWMNGESEGAAHQRVYADVSSWRSKPIGDAVSHFESLFGPATTQVLQNGSGDKWYLWKLITPRSDIYYSLGLLDSNGSVSSAKFDRTKGK